MMAELWSAVSKNKEAAERCAASQIRQRMTAFCTLQPWRQARDAGARTGIGRYVFRVTQHQLTWSCCCFDDACLVFLLLTAGLTADFVWCRISIRRIQRWCELRLLWSWTQMQCLRNFFQHHTVLGLFLSSCPWFLNAPCRAAVQWGRAHQELVFNCAVFTSSLKQTSPQLWGSAGNGGGEPHFLTAPNPLHQDPQYNDAPTLHTHTPKHTSLSSAAFLQTTPLPPSTGSALEHTHWNRGKAHPQLLCAKLMTWHEEWRP